MGEFMDGDSPDQIARQDRVEKYPESGFDTGVEDCTADGEKSGVPIFKVTKGEFFQNMNYGRKRLRFKSGGPVQTFQQGTRYKNPFYISYKEENSGREYLRKIR
jgi:hypothetical protein